MVVGPWFLWVCSLDTIYLLLGFRISQGCNQGADHSCGLMWGSPGEGSASQVPCCCQHSAPCPLWDWSWEPEATLVSLPPGPFWPDCFLRASKGELSWNKGVTIICNISMEMIACHYCHILLVRTELIGTSHRFLPHCMGGDYTGVNSRRGHHGHQVRVKSGRITWWGQFLYDFSLTSCVCLLNP